MGCTKLIETITCDLCGSKTKFYENVIIDMEFVKVCEKCLLKLRQETHSTCKYCNRFVSVSYGYVYSNKNKYYLTCPLCTFKYE
jgi:hypothetical protein